MINNGKRVLGAFVTALALTVVVVGVSGNVDAASGCKASILKDQGRIKEDGNGYVVAVKDDRPTKICVTQINARRQAKYESIAKKDKIPVEEVAKIAASKLDKK